MPGLSGGNSNGVQPNPRAVASDQYDYVESKILLHKLYLPLFSSTNCRLRLAEKIGNQPILAESFITWGIFAAEGR
ncbi:hypothetical protein SDJN02_14839, partial [Cucurbita argyrosperma subsp. argyrosperma]